MLTSSSRYANQGGEPHAIATNRGCELDANVADGVSDNISDGVEEPKGRDLQREVWRVCGYWAVK